MTIIKPDGQITIAMSWPTKPSQEPTTASGICCGDGHAEDTPTKNGDGYAPDISTRLEIAMVYSDAKKYSTMDRKGSYA